MVTGGGDRLHTLSAEAAKGAEHVDGLGDEEDVAYLPPLEDPPGLHRAFVSRSRSVLDDHVGGAHAEVHEEVAHERGDGRDRRPGVESSPRYDHRTRLPLAIDLGGVEAAEEGVLGQFSPGPDRVGRNDPPCEDDDRFRGVGPLQERWELPLQRPEGRVNRCWYAGQHESGEGDRQEEQPPAALPPFAPQARDEERRDQEQEGEWLKEIFRKSKIHERNLVLVCGAEGRRFAVESPGGRPRRSAPGGRGVWGWPARAMLAGHQTPPLDPLQYCSARNL